MAMEAIIHRSETEIIQGSVELAGSGTGVINITLPNWPVVVEKIQGEATDLSGNCIIERNDKGSNLITRGPVKFGLLGFQVLDTYIMRYSGPEPFACDPNCVLTFSLTDLSAQTNVVNIAVHVRKIYKAGVGAVAGQV